MNPYSSGATQLAFINVKHGTNCMHDLVGAEWSCLCPMSIRHRQETMRLYGTNDMSAVRPSILRLAGAILAYPPFIVQATTHTSFHSKAACPSLLISSWQDVLSCRLAERCILSAAFLLQDLSCFKWQSCLVCLVDVSCSDVQPTQSACVIVHLHLQQA